MFNCILFVSGQDPPQSYKRQNIEIQLNGESLKCQHDVDSNSFLIAYFIKKEKRRKRKSMQQVEKW